MHFKTGVVSEPITGAHQFRTKAQTSKNVKKRNGEFAISSGGPPPAGPGPQAFLVLLLVVPRFHRHRVHSNGKGRKTNTTRNRRNLHPPHTIRMWGNTLASVWGNSFGIPQHICTPPPVTTSTASTTSPTASTTSPTASTTSPTAAPGSAVLAISQP